MNIKYIIISLLALLNPLLAKSQETAIDSLAVYHASTAMNSGKIQQEMVYLHLDNNSYYRGDRIFFACYLVTSGKLKPSDLSQTVYVELLNPSGKIIDRCVLRAVDGRCHGALLADETPFYSGYYEIRAYTRYMLNFGPEAIFSRVIPIYASPQKEGDWADRTILTHDTDNMPIMRQKTQKVKNIELKFYPEGGHMVSGLPARVAFELTDDTHRPLPGIEGRIIDRTNDKVMTTFRSGHMGRGTVDFIPENHQYAAEVSVNGKRYWCDLPQVEKDGITLRVNSHPESDKIEIAVNRTPGYACDAVGVSLTCRGELYGRSIVDISEQEGATFSMSTSRMPSGVGEITVFNTKGQPLADRMFFHNRNESVSVDYTFDKSSYRPFEPIDLEVRVSDSQSGIPVSIPLSLSVADADNHIEYPSNMMADLLLASHIKGYIHNPAYYFEKGNENDLDNLLMVQGWRRYSWSQLAGMEPIRIDSLPEQGIEVRGQILERMGNKPRAGISVSAMLAPADSTNIFGSTARAYTFTTDDKGRFMFHDDLIGKYMLLLSSSNKNKVSKNRILLDLSDFPSPRAYDVGELKVSLNTQNEQPVERVTTEDLNDLIDNGTKLLNEVEVTAKYTKAQEMARYMENSVVSYDVLREVNALRDNGDRYIKTLSQLLPEMDKNFKRGRDNTLTYNGKGVLIIADPDFAHNRGLIDELMGMENLVETKKETIKMSKSDPGAIPVDYIKNVFVNNTQDALMTYAARMAEQTSKSQFGAKMDAAKKYGCVVFIEFYPDRRSKLQAGIRRDVIEGYTPPSVEFYSPDYSVTPPFEPDFRRTLYWNPDVQPDADGIARVRFFNNSSATGFSVSSAHLPL